MEASLAIIAMLMILPAHSQVIHGGLTPWTNSGSCSQTCGGGQQTQLRTCTNPPPSGGGDPCDPEESRMRTVSCNAQQCPAACSYTKPCSCSNVTQYTTGTEPDLTLVHFAGIKPTDLDTARSYLTIWRQDLFDAFCKAAKCNLSTLDGGAANMTTYLTFLVNVDSAYKAGSATMRDVIDCNENTAIEGNLWKVYDHLCDRSVAINEIKRDLMQKKTLLENERKRCTDRGWFRGFVETFYKKW
ncbi:A disintegrin and metalloproteinase with thrombospondin motifs 6-like [Hydractinia symbiolongicarpus]|uniref:A disintegrin and metalloproteinase with thrombospondin motifs 6-like n=1 Tax=Hydractinia symbiolongicarpus TaxID=13093 RepID=UPI0025504AC4|nr:A disintegrin and metalloproteinase with thrombospondin motifs 6-like [Hydractinia symbiolongicarpus]